MTAGQRWRRERPSKEGWYWFKDENGIAMYWVEWKPVWKCFGIPGKRVADMDGEWCGPLEPPHDQEAG